MLKNKHDDDIKCNQFTEAMRGRNRNDTHANKLKTEMGQKHAARLKGDEMPEYTDAHKRGTSLF